MKKKEKVLVTIIGIYFTLLIAILLMLFICIFTNTDSWLIFVYLFFIVFVVGYLVVTIIRINTYVYICEECHNAKKLSFIEGLFTTRGDNARIAKCPVCQKKQLMKRQCR